MDRLYLDFIRKRGLECQKEIVDSETSELDQTPKDIKGWFLAFTDFIAGAIMPALPVIVAGGMINAVLVLLTTYCGLDSTSGTYIILHAIYTGAFSFMPIYIGIMQQRKSMYRPCLERYSEESWYAAILVG